MINLTHDRYKNVHINIHGTQILITVGLRIEERMKEFLPETQVRYCQKSWVYFQKAQGELQKMSEQKILETANRLLKEAMITCRKAKKQSLDAQISFIAQEKEPRLFPSEF